MSSDTPRTDAKAYSGDWEQVVSADFARVLERELADVKVRLKASDKSHKDTLLELEAESDIGDQLRAEIKRLKDDPLAGKPSFSGEEYLRRVADETESKPIIGGLKQ